MRISECFPSKYLKANDIPTGRRIPVTIADVRLEHVDEGEDATQKPVVYFEGKNKGLVLNKTNAAVIAAAYGDDTDLWHGLPIELYTTTTNYKGQMVPCLRVAVPSTAAAGSDDETF